MSSILKIIIRNLTYQKLRTALTLLGIVIGIAAIVSLISIGGAIQRSVNEQFEQVGTDKIIINPGSPTSVGFSGSAFGTETLNEDDVETVKRINEVETAFGILSKTAKIEFGREKAYAMIWGMPVGDAKELFEEMQGYEIAEGRDLKESDRYSTIIGDMAKDELFEDEIKIRNKLKINGKNFRVVGILEKIGNPVDDMSVIVPIESGKKIFNQTDELSMIFVDVRDTADVDKVSEKIKEELKEERGAEDFKVQSFGDMMEMANQILGILRYLFVGIAAISLLVGGIGIMNIMLMTVMERTKEIGVMKATGATNKTILLLFLGESALVGLIGGLIGFGLGFAGSYLIAQYAEGMVGIPVNVILNPLLFGGAMLFSVLVGAVSGVYPAYRASKLDPVDALRYE